jgi:virulence-associated protein VagC
MTTTEVYQNGEFQTVRLPEGFQFSASEVSIRRQGEAVVLEPVKSRTWPIGFFEQIRIDDPAFERPEQPAMPPAPSLDPQ